MARGSCQEQNYRNGRSIQRRTRHPLMHIIRLDRTFRKTDADKWQQSKMKSLCKHATPLLRGVYAGYRIGGNKRWTRQCKQWFVSTKINIDAREKKKRCGTSKLISYFFVVVLFVRWIFVTIFLPINIFFFEAKVLCHHRDEILEKIWNTSQSAINTHFSKNVSDILRILCARLWPQLRRYFDGIRGCDELNVIFLL